MLRLDSASRWSGQLLNDRLTRSVSCLAAVSPASLSLTALSRISAGMVCMVMAVSLRKLIVVIVFAQEVADVRP